MQRVSALLPSWGDRSSRSSAGSTGKNSLDKVRGWADKIPANNRLSGSRYGREAFWAGTLDKECEKAARILQTFCREGLVAPDDRPSSPTTTSSNQTTSQVLKKIPPRIIQNAVGLAVFSSMRSGLWSSTGSGGSGILIARKSDGTWSPPSGLILQTATLGFLLGVDVYDCVVVINTFTMLEAMGRPKVVLGTDVAMTTGPLVSLGLWENEIRCTDLSDTVFTYVRSKGQLSEVKLEGTVLNERADENERFYGNSFSVPKILAGDVNQSLPQLRPLTEMLKAAEGRTDFDASLLEQLSAHPAPSDASIDSSSSAASLAPIFGIPDMDDPDPYGVLALESAGLEIREAGSRLRPDSSQFEFCPSPSSSVFPRAGRHSVDTYSLTRSNRGSYMSNRTMTTERSHLTDAQTQTEVNTPNTTPSPEQSEDGHQINSSSDTKEPEVSKEPEEVDYTKIDISALRKLSAFPDLDEPIVMTTSPIKEESLDMHANDHGSQTSTAQSETENGADADDEDDEDDQDDSDDDDDGEEFEDAEEPVVYEVATAQPPRMAIVASQAVQVKGSVVTIPRRVPPPLPARSSARLSRQNKSEFGDVNAVNMVSSPLRQEFDLDQTADEAATPKADETFSLPLSAPSSPAKAEDVPLAAAEDTAVKGTTTPSETSEKSDYTSRPAGNTLPENAEEVALAPAKEAQHESRTEATVLTA
ncbi:hypothetical protein PG993_002744 [Apiospora rasikravindrae]|uniref:Ysc84 actin-binding domain-containing protein n=1 Tax=Apiospora rasikravindrae TaxID=990691 RepID=A0ABR1TXI2_9PEZI